MPPTEAYAPRRERVVRAESDSHNFRELVSQLRREKHLDDEWTEAVLAATHYPYSKIHRRQRMVGIVASAPLLLFIIAIMLAFPGSRTSGLNGLPVNGGELISEDANGMTAGLGSQTEPHLSYGSASGVDDDNEAPNALHVPHSRFLPGTITVDVRGAAQGQRRENMMSGNREAVFDLATHQVSVSLLDGQEAIVDVNAASNLTRVFIDIAVPGQPAFSSPQTVFEGNSMVLRLLNNSCVDSSHDDPLVFVMGETRHNTERAIIVPQRNCAVSVTVEERS